MDGLFGFVHPIYFLEPSELINLFCIGWIEPFIISIKYPP